MSSKHSHRRMEWIVPSLIAILLLLVMGYRAPQSRLDQAAKGKGDGNPAPTEPLPTTAPIAPAVQEVDEVPGSLKKV